MDYEKIEQSEKRRRILGKGVTYLFLTIWALIVLFPFYWMLLTSVKSYGAITRSISRRFSPRRRLLKTIRTPSRPFLWQNIF